MHTQVALKCINLLFLSTGRVGLLQCGKSPDISKPGAKRRQKTFYTTLVTHIRHDQAHLKGQLKGRKVRK